MLIPIHELSENYRVKPRGVLHVGAHLAEEEEEYLSHNWDFGSKIYWVESQPALINQLNKKINKHRCEVIESTAWGSNDVELTLKITSNSQSSSLYRFGTHESDYPEIKVVNEIKVTTERLDKSLAGKIFDFINIDIQGAELEALKGLGDLLDQTKWIYLEVNKKSVYEGCANIIEIDDFLKYKHFTRVETRWIPFKGWGDAIYVKKNVLEELNLNVYLIRFREIAFYARELTKLSKYKIKKLVVFLSK